MPMYEYQCDSCGYQFELLRKLSDAAVTDCPKCAKADVRKLVSAPKFQLKGTGWYETDFKNKQPAGKEKDAAADKTDAKANSKSSDSAASSDKSTKSVASDSSPKNKTPATSKE